jgi:tetratricopeptide (TPR) repeat protein
MQSALGSADPAFSLGKNATAREVFERVAVEAEKATQIDPRSRSLLLASIAEITLHIGEPQQALRLLEKTDLTKVDERSRDDAMQTKARVYAALGDAPSARRILEEQGHESHDLLSGTRWKLLETALDLQQGKLARAIETSLTLSSSDIPDEFKDQARMLLGDAYDAQDHPVDAFHTYEQLLEDQKQRLPDDHPAILRTWLALARVETTAGLITILGDSSAEALRIGESLYGRHSLGYLDLLRVRRDLFGARSAHDEERAVQLQIVPLVEELIGADTPIALRENMSLAEATRQSGELRRLSALANHESTDTTEIRERFEAATKIYESVIEKGERLLPVSDYNLFKYRTALGYHLTRRKQFAEAKIVLEKALDSIKDSAEAQTHDMVFVARFALNVCKFAAAGTAENQARLIASLQLGREQSRSSPAIATMKAIEVVARELGVAVAAD